MKSTMKNWDMDLKWYNLSKAHISDFTPHSVPFKGFSPALSDLMYNLANFSECLKDSGWGVGCQEVASRTRTQMDTRVSTDDDRNLPTKRPAHHCPWHAAAFADSSSVRLFIHS